MTKAHDKVFPFLYYLFFLALIFGVTHEAKAQSIFMPDDDTFADIIKDLSAGDIESAEMSLDTLPDSVKNANYHYLRGALATQQMNDAGAFRMARLARRMKRHFEDALELDPDHEFSHFGLLQFHRFAPGVMGGRERLLEFHQQRLIELNSFLQFPAALVKAQVEDDENTQRAVYNDWVVHSPQMFEAHYGYLSDLITWGDYEQANEVADNAFALANEEQLDLIQYQQVRMAALAALDKDTTQDVLLTEQDWFVQAYKTGINLLHSETRAEQIDESWLNLRLAQIEWALKDIESAHARVEVIISTALDERLQTQAAVLQDRLTKS